MNQFKRSFELFLNCRYAHVKNANSANSPSIDIAEVNKFKRLSSEWWSPSGGLRVLQKMNKLRVPFIKDGLVNLKLANEALVDTDVPLSGIKILDAGCGGGLLSEPLARLGAHVTGLDAAGDLVQIAENHKTLDEKLSDNLTYVHSSIEDFASQNIGQFDAVVSSEVLEHVVAKKEFVQSCVDCVKPGGSIFITTLSDTYLCRMGIIMSEYVMFKVPMGTHEFDKLISPHQLQRILEECDCTTRRIHGMMLNPLNNSWHWISNTDINYALHAIKN